MADKTIKAIQTEYNGIKFRSRLEARWAVFFDTAKIRYEYEPEGYETEDGTRYLPDFYLPDFDAYVEVKRDTEDGIKEVIGKCDKAIVWGGEIKKIIILSDVPQGESVDGGMWHFPCVYWREDSTCWGWWFFCDCGAKDGEPIFGQTSRWDCSLYPSSLSWILKEKSIKAVSDVELRTWCPACEWWFPKTANRTEETIRQDIMCQEQFNQKVFECFKKAKQSRFEFGETPKTGYERAKVLLEIKD